MLLYVARLPQCLCVGETEGVCNWRGQGLDRFGQRFVSAGYIQGFSEERENVSEMEKETQLCLDADGGAHKIVESRKRLAVICWMKSA